MKRLAVLLFLALAACESDQPPAACGPIPQVTVNAGETATVAACFNDPNGDMLAYSATSSNPGVATASVSGTSITIAAVAPGSASVTVTASDPGGLEGQQSFQVIVPNRPPIARGTISSIVVQVGHTESVDVSSYFTEPDGEQLVYGATSSNPEVATTSVVGGTVRVAAVAKGTTSVTVTATDPGGLSAMQTFQSRVPNRSPEPTGTIPDQSVHVGETAAADLSPYFSDPDGDALTYKVASSNGAAVLVSVAGSVVSLEAIGQGAAVVTVTATDTEGLSAQQGFEVEVPNRAPMARGAVAAHRVLVGDTAEVDMVSYFSDADGDALSYAAASSNGAAVSVSVAGSVVSLGAVAKGTAVVTVTATDPEGLSAQQVFEVTVPNRAPEAWGAVAAQTVVVGDTAEVDMVSYFSDPDGDALSYAAASSNGAAVSVSVAGSVVSLGAIGKGTAVVTVTATDPEGLSAEQVFEVTVPNRAPEAWGAVAAQTLVVGDTAEVDMVSYFSDPDGDALSYAAASSNGAAVTVSVAGSVVSLEAIGKGIAVVTVTATDPEGLSAQQGFEVEVPSQAPVATGTVAPQTVPVGDTAEVDMVSYFSDPDGDALTYAAASSNGAVISVSVAGSVVSLEAVAKGTAAVTVTATDPEGLSAQQAFEVTVPNRAPVARGEVAAQTVVVGDTAEVDMDLYFRDPDGDPLSYAAASSNGAAVLVSVAGSVVSLEAIARGTAVVTVTATDPEGLSAQQGFEVTVPNLAPVARGAVPAQTVLAGETASVGMVPYFSDPDGDALTYAAASSNGAAVSVSVAGSVVSLEAIAQGTAVVTVTATDPEGLSAQQAFEVDVRDPTVPTIVRVEPTVLVEGESVTITGWGFSASPGDNDVFVGELPAPVLSSTATRLSITVPRADCLPPREVVLRVSTTDGGDSVAIGSTPLSEEDRDWPRFEWRHTSSGDGCMHLPGNAEGGEFLIGVSSISEDPSHLVSVTLAGTPGDASVLGAYAESAAPGAGRVLYSKHPAPLVSASGRVRPPPSAVDNRLRQVPGGAEPYWSSWRAGHAEAMARNQALVEELGRPDWSAGSSAKASALSSLAEGDTVTLNTICCDNPRVRAIVRLVTDNFVWLDDDLANPDGPFTDAELKEMDDFYSDHAKPVHDNYFGGLSDVDGNGRILVLMTNENESAGVNPCDLYPKDQCRWSNEAEIFYHGFPDSDSRDGMLSFLPTYLTHEATHLIQYTAWVFGDAPRRKGEWELEGGAILSEHFVGHRLFGLSSGQNLGYPEYSAGRDWYRWHGGLFDFFSGGRGAPEECTWLTYKGWGGNDGPCELSLNYWVGALVLQFAMDRWGGRYPGGERALLKRMTQSPLIGFANLVDVSPGWSIERILGEFYATLWLEGTAGRDTPGMTSWDVHDIVSRFDDSLWLKPYSSSSATPSVSARIRAGSSMFFHWTPDGPLPPASFKVDPADDGPVFVWAIRAR